MKIAVTGGNGGFGRLVTGGLLDAGNNALPAYPQHLINMTNVDPSAMDKRIFDCEIAILCDVDNKLLGPKGAAPVFGPQNEDTANGSPHVSLG